MAAFKEEWGLGQSKPILRLALDWEQVLTLSKIWLTILPFQNDGIFGTEISEIEINKKEKIKCICLKVEMYVV